MNLPPSTIVQQNANEIVLELDMSPSLDAFRDHFPNHPLLPGVVQVDWAVRYAQQYLKLFLPSARQFQVKFRSIIHPKMIILLTLHHDETKDRLSFTYHHKEEIMSSGSIKLDPTS